MILPPGDLALYRKLTLFKLLPTLRRGSGGNYRVVEQDARGYWFDDARRWRKEALEKKTIREIPAGWEGQVRPRSGLALRHGVTVVNAPGTIDSDYRGEVGVIVINLGSEPFSIRRGDRIAQLVVVPVATVRWEEVESLGTSDRGEGGFGSTGS